MPKRKTIEAAKKDLREGKSPSTAAGEFIKEEMESFNAGKRGVGTRKQAIAIGLAKARAAGVPLKKQKPKLAGEITRRGMRAALLAGQHARKKKKAARKSKTKKK